MRFLSALLLILAIRYSHTDNTDYVVNEADGHAYKIMYKGETWENARDMCVRDGAKLAVPKTKDEFLFIQNVVRGMQFQKLIGVKYRLLAWLGIQNLDDYRVWKNVDGEDINTTGFHEWATDYTKNVWPNPAEPHCVGIDSVNPGLREHWCHLAQPYICEKLIKSGGQAVPPPESSKNKKH